MELYEKLSSSQDFQSVIDRCKVALEGANISEEDFKNICLGVYGFQETKAKEYNLDMEKIYYNLSKLEGIYVKEPEYFSEMEDEGDIRNGEFAQLSESFDDENSHMAILGDNSTISSERVSAIYINEEISDSPEARTEATIHELQHLFQTQYQYDKDNHLNVTKLFDGPGVSDASQEAFAQSTTRDILDFFKLDTPNPRLGVLDQYDGKTCVVPTIGDVYGTLQPIATELERIDGQAIFKMLYDGQAYSGELNFGRIDKVLNGAYEYDFDSHIMLLDILKTKAEYELTTGQIDSIEYLKTLGHLDKIAPIIHTDSTEIQMLNASTDAQIVDMFYTRADGEKHLEDLSHLTRSEDCKAFLIALQGIREMAADGKLELSLESIENMKYYATESDKLKTQTVVVEYDGTIYKMTASNTSEYGTSRIVSTEELQHHLEPLTISETSPEILFSKLKDDKIIFADDKVILSQHPSESEMPLYMAYACAAEISPNLMVQNRFRTYPDITEIRDAEGNNLAHILAENNSRQMTLSMKFFRPEQLSELLTTPNNEGLTPIDIAIQNNNIAFFETAAKIGLNPEINYENEKAQSPLIASLSHGVSPKITEIILEDFNANPNKLTSEGKLALAQAITCNPPQIEKIEMLINNGANIDLPSYIRNTDQVYYTPTQIAAGMGDITQNLEALRICLENGGDIFEENNAGESVFQRAIQTHDTEILVIAAQSGYDKEDLMVDELKDVGFNDSDIERIESAIIDYDNDLSFV